MTGSRHGPRRCRAARPTPPAAASASSPRSTRPAAAGTEISVSGIARAAGVDRTFLYRHRDLLEQIHAARSRPARRRRPPGPPSPARRCKPTCSPPTNAPPGSHARVRQLEKRLSEALGEQAWRESGLGAPPDIDALNDKITQLEQQAADLRLQLAERDDELAAARAANRELMTRINHEPENR